MGEQLLLRDEMGQLGGLEDWPFLYKKGCDDRCCCNYLVLHLSQLLNSSYLYKFRLASFLPLLTKALVYT